MAPVVSQPRAIGYKRGRCPQPSRTTAHPPTTQNGARLRLRGLGMPTLHGAGHGDLIAEVVVRLPTQLTPAATRLAEELRAEREGTRPA
ncbi:MAG: DnaJ C-terminal domain-containing protein [Candidatus Dormibacteria bacterium]